MRMLKIKKPLSFTLIGAVISSGVIGYPNKLWFHCNCPENHEYLLELIDDTGAEYKIKHTRDMIQVYSSEIVQSLIDMRIITFGGLQKHIPSIMTRKQTNDFLYGMFLFRRFNRQCLRLRNEILLHSITQLFDTVQNRIVNRKYNIHYKITRRPYNVALLSYHVTYH